MVTAAAHVFATHGFAAGTTNRIAERAGVSIGTLYMYFPNKQALAKLLVERHIAGMLRRASTWAAMVMSDSLGLRDALRALVEAALDAHEHEPRLHHVLLEEAPLSPEVHDIIRRAERDAAHTIAAVLGRYREVRRVDSERTARMLVALATDLTHRHVSDPGDATRDAVISEITDVFDAYVRRPDGPARGSSRLPEASAARTP